MKRNMMIGLITLGITVGIGTTALAHGNGLDNWNPMNFEGMHDGNHLNWTEQQFNHMFEDNVDFEEMENYMKDIHLNWGDEYIEEMYQNCHGNSNVNNYMPNGMMEEF